MSWEDVNRERKGRSGFWKCTFWFEGRRHCCQKGEGYEDKCDRGGLTN